MPSIYLRSKNRGVDPGLKTKTQPALSVDAGLLKCNAFHFDEEGSLTKWKGFRNRLNGIEMNQVVEGFPLTLPVEFTGLFGYQKSDGFRHVYATGKIRVYKQVGASFVPLSLPGPQTGTADDFYGHFILNDAIYFGNGKDGVLKSDGTTGVFGISVAAPTFAGTASISGAGPLTGVYSYRTSFYSTLFDAESNLSPQSNDVVAAGSTLTLSGISVSLDPQVDKTRIYRTTTGGGVWLFIGEIDNGVTTFVDPNGDSALGIAGEEFAFGVAPKPFNMFKVWNGFVFAAKTGTSDLHYSGQNAPHAWHIDDMFQLDAGDGDSITAISDIAGNLVVFKNDSTWNVFGEDRFTFVAHRQASSIGATSHHGVVRLPSSEHLAFPSEEGFYVYNGSSHNYISKEIESVYRGISDANKRLIYGAVYKPLNVAIWLCRNGSGSKGDFFIIHDYIQNAWSTREVPNKGNILSVIEDDFNRDVVYMGGYDGFVREGDSGHMDDSLPIEASFTTRALPVGANTPTAKSFTTLFVYYKPQNGSTVHFFAAVDDENGTYHPIGDVDMSFASGVARLRFNLYGTRLFVKCTHSDATPCVIRGAELEYIEHSGRV